MLTKQQVLRPSVIRDVLIGVVVSIAAIGIASCAWSQKAGAIAEDVVVDCAIPAIESEVADLLDEAGRILHGGEADWPKQLDNLGSNSVWAGYCAVQVVLQDLTPPAPTSARAAPADPAAARAQAYLAAKHVTAEHAGTGAHYRAVRRSR